MTHYYEGRSGDSFVDATLHTTRGCDELDGPVRPLADSSVPDEPTMCGMCSDVEDAEEKLEDDPGENPHLDEGTREKYLINQGVCPWCDDYEGDGVPQHASSAHPDAWASYSD